MIVLVPGPETFAIACYRGRFDQLPHSLVPWLGRMALHMDVLFFFVCRPRKNILDLSSAIKAFGAKKRGCGPVLWKWVLKQPWRFSDDCIKDWICIYNKNDLDNKTISESLCWDHTQHPIRKSHARPIREPRLETYHLRWLLQFISFSDSYQWTCELRIPLKVVPCLNVYSLFDSVNAFPISHQWGLGRFPRVRREDYETSTFPSTWYPWVHDCCWTDRLGSWNIRRSTITKYTINMLPYCDTMTSQTRTRNPALRPGIVRFLEGPEAHCVVQKPSCLRSCLS